ncbi:MAG: hypothetical protein NTX50_21570 [Candidatus Sumerlaeota bacterium]|nr:hypothetical protein [Candidatus Sumerlaeota bacterium]
MMTPGPVPSAGAETFASCKETTLLWSYFALSSPTSLTCHDRP